MIELGYLAPAERGAFVPGAARDFARLFANGALLARVLCNGDAFVGTAGAVLFDRLPYPGGTLHAELSGIYLEAGAPRRRLRWPARHGDRRRPARALRAEDIPAPVAPFARAVRAARLRGGHDRDHELACHRGGRVN